MPAMFWQFPPNPTNAPIGPRDRGIEHYTGQRLSSLVRETLQNSLDAQEHRGQTPANVDFSLADLETASFNGQELAGAINACISALKPKDESYRKMFRKALTQLDKESIPTLVITDSNTTGARDDGEDDCPWAALTRGSGESSKPGHDASGSYGIGKAAAYSATDLRTVLYTTTFTANGNLESRFVGKSILSGHQDPQGKKVTSEGYLGGPDFASLCNGDIPVQYRLESQGLCLRIPGYTAPKNWQQQVIEIAIDNFFHAIIKGQLAVTVAGETVSKETVGDYAGLLTTRVSHLLSTSGMDPVAKGYIEGIGEIRLRIKVHEAGDDNTQDVALVRDAGMMITRERGKMGPAQFRVPAHWHRFTAIVECLSDPDGKSAVRDCESTSHNELDIDRIPNDEDREPAKQALRQLGTWMRGEIRKHAEPPSNTEPVNATEAADLLPIIERGNNPSGKPRPNGGSISAPVQRGTSAPTVRTTPKEPKEPKEPKSHQPPQPNQPPRPQVIAQRDALARAKFRVGGRSETHGLTIQIPPFAKRINNVQLQAVTEHGGDIAMKIARVWSNGKELKIKQGKISAITPGGKGPVTLEINLQEPVAARRFRLRPASDKDKS